MLTFPDFVFAAELFNEQFISFRDSANGPFGFVCRCEFTDVPDLRIEWHEANNFSFVL